MASFAYVWLAVICGAVVTYAQLNVSEIILNISEIIEETDGPLDCFLEPEPGLCEAYIPRFFYNPMTKRCHQFIYGGCGANANNFKTKEDCNRLCAPQCFMKADPGLCEVYFPKWFYNSDTHDCETFVYGGCNGNDNKFDSRNDCLDQCGDICEATPDTGPCKGYFPRFFYNSTSEVCETFIYGGCDGNQNNFETADQCADYCGRRY